MSAASTADAVRIVADSDQPWAALGTRLAASYTDAWCSRTAGGPARITRPVRVARAPVRRTADGRAAEVPPSNVDRLLGTRGFAGLTRWRTTGVRRASGEPEQDRVAAAEAGPGPLRLLRRPRGRQRQTPHRRRPRRGGRLRSRRSRVLGCYPAASQSVASRPAGDARRRLDFRRRSGRRPRGSGAGGARREPRRTFRGKRWPHPRREERRASPRYLRALRGRPTRAAPRRPGPRAQRLLRAPQRVLRPPRRRADPEGEGRAAGERPKRSLRSESVTFPRPVVIRLVTYVLCPARQPGGAGSLAAPCSRATPGPVSTAARGTHLTVDHVVPRSRGGESELGEHRHLLCALQPPQGQPHACRDGHAAAQGAPRARPNRLHPRRRARDPGGVEAVPALSAVGVRRRGAV